MVTVQKKVLSQVQIPAKAIYIPFVLLVSITGRHEIVFSSQSKNDLFLDELYPTSNGEGRESFA